MSVGRKDWSALSSLARQWSLEDEEEQERERRRRRRNLSSATDDEAPGLSQSGAGPAAERLPSVEEAEGPRLPPQACKNEDEDIPGILRTRQERRQRRQMVEAAQAPVWERLEAEPGRDSTDPGQAKKQPLTPKKEVELPPHRRLSREQRGRWAGGEESAAGSEPAGGEKGVSEKTPVLEKSPSPEKTSALGKRLMSGETSTPEETVGPPEQTSVLEKTAVLEKRAIVEKKSILEKMSVSEKLPGKTSGLEGRLVSEKALLFEKPLVSKRAAASGCPAQEQPAFWGSRSASSEQRGRALPEKNPLSLAGQGASGPLPAAARLPPITLQVKIPSREEGVDASSPTQATYSSSLKRSSSRTISFRMSPRKENTETTLTRSASVRLPVSTARLGEKLERYHTAVQRSESVKSPGSSRTEFFVAPAGVASKRHLFEKEVVGRSQAEPASGRKENLKLSGVVTSRLNLWISKTQEPGAQDPQEVQKESAAAKRTQWGRKAVSSLEAEV
ncbi:ladinin-1 isoform X2 [Manis javanica]|uniref:ladinin-1 isoform X2 n=1 Tax=Manis javanica TaxID=9974 RepID=UPI003C6CD8EE